MQPHPTGQLGRGKYCMMHLRVPAAATRPRATVPKNNGSVMMCLLFTTHPYEQMQRLPE